MSNKNAFIFYETFAEQLHELDDATRLKFYDAIIAYALHGEVPSFTGIEKALWVSIAFGIDEAKNRRETQKNNGSKGGRPATINTNAETQNNPTKPNETQNNPIKAKKSDSNLNENENVNINVNENENENVKSVETPSLAPHSADFSKKIFTLFKNAGLPCANGNELTFLQRDFAFAIAHLHRTSEFQHLHSDEIITAVQNYILCLKDESTYITNKYSFERLVKLKNFADFLPANFIQENFKRWDTGGTTAQSEQPVIQIKGDKCPECGFETLYWDNTGQVYRCRNCSKTKTWEEINAHCS